MKRLLIAVVIGCMPLSALASKPYGVQSKKSMAIESAKLGRLLDGKKLECRVADREQGGTLVISAEKDRHGVPYTAVNADKLRVGYAVGDAMQVQVGEQVLVSFGDDGRVVVLFGSDRENWQPSENPRCAEATQADVLLYPEFTKDGKTEVLDAVCCLK